MVVFDPLAVQTLIRNQTPYSGCKGSVVRLRVTDLMTYHSAELRSGAHVNLILGPNGSGKSTIVCAICLGLAGKPKILGRALKLQEYIRHGAKSATIEIELFNPDGMNFVIKRYIRETKTLKKDGTVNHGTKSRWHLQGKRASPAQVEELTQSLNIQLDNLCQFLPQDRVQDFVGMNSFSLLQNTQKALGNDTLFLRHERLIGLTVNLKEIEGNLVNHMNHLKSRTQITKRMENDVKNYKEREDLKARIAELQAKQTWIVYLKSREVFANLKAQLETVKHAKTQEEAKLAPLKQSLKALDSKKTKMQADLERAKTVNDSFMNGIKRKVEEEYDRVDSNVAEENAKHKEHTDAESERLKRVENFTVKVQGYEKQIDEIRQRGDMDDARLKSELHNLENKIKKQDDSILEINDQDEKDESTRRYLLSKIRSTEIELSKMNDLRMSRMKYLEKYNPHVYEAVQFYSKPENLTHFKGRIHEPMLLHISVNDLAYGCIVERHIGFSELNGFFCEHEDDVGTMLELNKQRNKRVSVTHFEGPDTAPYQRPQCPHSRDFMQKCGFKMTILDLLEGTDYYIAYLSERFHLERIPIGDAKSENLFQDIADNTSLNLFYTESSVFSIKQSNYSRNKVLQFQGIQSAKVLTTKINAAEKQNLHEQVSAWRSEEKKLEGQVNGRKRRKAELEEERQTIEDNIRDINARIEYRRNLMSRLESVKKSLAVLEKEKKDLTKIKAITDAAVLKHRLKLIEVAEFVAREMGKAQDKGSRPIILRRQKNLFQSRVESLQNELEEMQGDVKQLESKLTALQPQVEQAAKEAETNKKEAIEVSNMHAPPPEVAGGELNEKAVEKELLQANTQLGFWMETDPKIVREYQEKMKEIADLGKQKDLGEKKLSEVKAEIEKEKQAWLTPLQDLIGTVNRNFGRYFTSMGCAGEVQLQKADDENDFAKYGIKILVKFRSSEPLSELGGTKGGTLQSGGERVISTALYILALQELTTVPFRGMDATNEARFFNLLCSLARGPNTPQYFLLTPKMLPPVDYPDNVDFHIIFSGPHVNVPLAVHSGADSSDDEGEDD